MGRTIIDRLFQRFEPDRWVRHVVRSTGLSARLKHVVAHAVTEAPGLSAKLIPMPRRAGAYLIEPALGKTALVPPPHLWEGYASTEAEYLKCGERDVGEMLRILDKRASRGRVLDLGCASGRMLRFIPRSDGAEHWGLDINANHIAWCQQNLSPPMLFATITTAPHLPFEDAYFDLIYCGSVFTHISDLAEAWLLEVRRVLRPNGYAYITIHTRRSIHLLRTKFQNDPLFAPFVASLGPTLDRTEGREWSVLTIGADPSSQVFYDVPSLRERWSRIMPVLDTVEEAHDHQAAVLMQKRKKAKDKERKTSLTDPASA